MERYVLGFLACRAGDSPSTARQRLSTPMCTRIRHMGCAHFLPLPRYFLHRPTGMLTVSGVSWQGYVSFAESNPRPTHVHVTFHRPLELALELTDCCVRVLTTSASQRVSACILNLPRPLLHRPTELTLELTDCCVRVLTTSASQRVSACILNLPRRFFHRPDGTSRVRFLACRAGDSTSSARQH